MLDECPLVYRSKHIRLSDWPHAVVCNVCLKYRLARKIEGIGFKVGKNIGNCCTQAGIQN